MEFYWQLFSMQTFKYLNMLKYSSYVLFVLLMVLRRLHFMIHFKIIILKWYCIIFWDKCYFDDVQGNKMKKKEMQKGKKTLSSKRCLKVKNRFIYRRNRSREGFIICANILSHGKARRYLKLFIRSFSCANMYIFFDQKQMKICIFMIFRSQLLYLLLYNGTLNTNILYMVSIS